MNAVLAPVTTVSSAPREGQPALGGESEPP